MKNDFTEMMNSLVISITQQFNTIRLWGIGRIIYCVRSSAGMRLLGKGSSGEKEVIISMIGPPNAGKTTFVRYLETQQPVLEPVNTTLGIEMRSNPILIDNWRIKIIDTGGQELFAQAFWEIAVEQSDVVIFVIDATITHKNNPKKNELMFDQFAYALDIIHEDQPIFFLLNKQDLKDQEPMTPADAIKKFSTDKLTGRSINFIPTSAKFGDGVEDTVKSVINTLTVQV